MICHLLPTWPLGARPCRDILDTAYLQVSIVSIITRPRCRSKLISWMKLVVKTQENLCIMK